MTEGKSASKVEGLYIATQWLSIAHCHICDLEACLRTQPQPKEQNYTKSQGPQETTTSCAYHQSKVDLTSWLGNILELSDDLDWVDEAEMLELFWHAAVDRALRLFWVAQLNRSVLWKCTPCPQLCSVGKFMLWLWSAFPSEGSCLEALFPTWWWWGVAFREVCPVESS